MTFNSQCLNLCGLGAGYIENFQLRVPKEPKQWDEKLGGSPFPQKRQKASKQWSGSSAGEISVLTGGLWDESALELLAQPLMYGKFMEHGHNGAVSLLKTRHAMPGPESFLQSLVHARIAEHNPLLVVKAPAHAHVNA